MSEEEKHHEEEVFGRKLDVTELDASGGFHDITYGELDDDRNNCVRYWHRQVYGGNGFPNCAATVGADSSCWRNDGCYNGTVVYDGMRTDCGRTWR